MKKLILYLILLLFGFNTKAQVTANFSMSDSVICTGSGVQLTDMSTPSWLTLEWDFGDGTVSPLTNPIHFYNAAGVGIYSIKLKVTDGVFTDSIVKNITVLGLPISNFSYSPINPTTNDTIQFTNLSTYANSYYWYFNYLPPPLFSSDTSTLANPKHLYETTETYLVYLTAINDSTPILACQDTSYAWIIVTNPTSVEEFSKEMVSEPYPNPTNNEFRVNYSVTNVDEESSLNMYNNQGQKVKAIKLNPLVNTITISVKELPPGIYYYEVCSKNSHHNNFRKLIISR